MSDYIEKVRAFDDELLDGYPDPGGLVKLSLSPRFAASLSQQPHEVLISCALSLARFVSHIQFFGNKYQAEVTHLKRTLESTRAKTIGGLEFKPRETDKAKIAAAYASNPRLTELEAELAEAERKAKYYEKMPDAFRDMINVMKYEIRRKEQEKELGKFNAPV